MQFLTLFLALASLAAALQRPNIVTVTKYLPFEQHPCYAYFMLGGEGDLPAEACRPGACCIGVQDVNTNTGHGGKNIGPDGHPLTPTSHSPNGSNAQGISGGAIVTQNSLAAGSPKPITSASVVAVLSSNGSFIAKTLIGTMTDDCTVAEDNIATAAVSVPETSRETVVITTTVPKVVTYTTTLSGTAIIETSTTVVISTETFTATVAISTTETLTTPIIITSTEVITANNTIRTSLFTTTCEEVVTGIGSILTTVAASKTLATPVEVTSTKVMTTNISTVTSPTTITSKETVTNSTTTESLKTPVIITSTEVITTNNSTITSLTTATSKETVTSVQPILTNSTTTKITTPVTGASTAVITISNSTTASLTTTTKSIITPSVVVTTNSSTIVEPITSLIPPPPTTTKSRVIPSSCPTPTCSMGIQYALYDNPFRQDTSPTYKSFSPAYFKKAKPVYSTTLQTAIYITDDNYGSGFNPLFKNAAAGYRGFLFACQNGRYRFNSPYSDDITIMWFGDKAYQNYTRDNADIIQFYYGDNRPRNIYRDLKAGTYYPIRVLWGNTGGASDLSLRIYGPNGEDVSGADQSGEHFLTTEACDGSYAPFPPWGKEL
ncbi:GLEYA adhesin domain protein [Cordyceps fumosorosea ARSEF 2679]|uniref:GLEYA adhesin domain protein n=1 Tax=Cordyceps fumosorosea (strain ARSEF 2679) TaxID=1081104 RepID=A0A168CA70_CORFA|nr:GLEYA adhesin domain protein [Cordyceps fumosorosea ARSEF 2679]OAA71138.1 GLEYA adhesin domain protein [Cordyceps fumosorosea ARSEF 2679]